MHSCSSVYTFLTRTSACRDQKSAGLVGVTFPHPAAGVWAISHLQAFVPPIASTSNPHSYLILCICGPQAETAIPAFCLGPLYHWRFLPQLLPLLMNWLYKKGEGFSSKAKSRGLGGVAQFNRVLVQCTQMPGFYSQYDINPSLGFMGTRERVQLLRFWFLFFQRTQNWFPSPR